MMESLESRLQRLAAITDQTDLPSAADVRRRGEARRRHHRLAVVAGSCLLLAAITTPVAIVLSGASTQRNSPTTKQPAATGSTPNTSTTTSPSTKAIPTATLPPTDLFNQIAVVQGHLLLSGETASTASAKTPICVSATVDPQTLDIGSGSEASCNDPAVDGATVGVVNGDIPDSNNATISIAHLDPQTGQTSVGPVVMTYGSYSDTRPVTAYGGGWLWIYDNSTIVDGGETVNVSNPGKAELLQVSTSSGQVVDTVSMPVLYRPLMSADSDGLWIGNSVEGGQCSGCSPPSALYYVAPGSDKAVVAIPDTTLIVCWLLGNEDNLWAGIGHEASGCSQEGIWRLDGTDFQPVFTVPDQGYDPNTVIGDESDGLWTMQWTHFPTRQSPTTPSTQEIVDINPDTGAETVVAILPALVVPLTGEGSGLLQGQAVVFDGSLYLLEPPFQLNGYLGYSTLVKVTLPQE
jgi:hypothetical protein